MRRLLPVLLLAAVALAAASATAAAPRGTAVGVGEREFTINPYRRSVPPGLVRFNIQNYGEDGHNLTIVGPEGRVLRTTPEIRAGRRHTLAVTLKRPGTYRLLCTIADHLQRGMRSKIRVVRPRT